MNGTAGGHADLVAPTRDLLVQSGLPWVLENVPGAPMTDYLTLCGSEFGLAATDIDGRRLQLRRHRQFESSAWLMGAGGCMHHPTMRVATVTGHGGGWVPVPKAKDDRPRGGYVPHVSVCGALMGIDWMKKRELSEAIPPAYAQFIGLQLMGQLSR